MIVVPNTPGEWATIRTLLLDAGVVASADQRCIGWVKDAKLVMAVCFTGFIGKTAQIHVANAPGWHFTPRAMLREVFHYAFETAEVEMLLGILNSNNERAMKYDLHLGFREVARFPGMHDHGGDLVVLAMRKSECRYLDQGEEHGQEPIRAASA